MRNMTARRITARGTLAWTRITSGEHRREDGVTIRRERGRSYAWVAYDAANRPIIRPGTRAIQVGGHTLVAARIDLDMHEEEAR